MASTHVQTAIDDLEAAGADPKLAAAIARNIGPRNGPSPIGILTAATALGFTLITVVFGWFMVEASHQRTDLRTEITANRDRIDAVGERITGVETRLSGDIANVSERLTRIETLLEERLPARR